VAGLLLPEFKTKQVGRQLLGKAMLAETEYPVE
jgi:hypothetical protein